MSGLVQTLIINWLFFFRALSTFYPVFYHNFCFKHILNTNQSTRKITKREKNEWRKKSQAYLGIFSMGFIRLNKRMGNASYQFLLLFLHFLTNLVWKIICLDRSFKHHVHDLIWRDNEGISSFCSSKFRLFYHYLSSLLHVSFSSQSIYHN